VSRPESLAARPAAPLASTRAERTAGRGAALLRLVRAYGLAVLLLLILLGLWYAVHALGWQPDYILPGPNQIADDLWHNRDGYWINMRTTIVETGVGFLAGIAFGTAVGVLIALVKPVSSAIYPIIVASQSFPTLAIAPLLVLWFGYGLLPKVILVIWFVFFPVAVATVTGLTATSSEALLFGRSLGAPGWKLFYKVRVPASLPYVFSGLKISASYAAIAAVVAEWAGSERGLGAQMLRANNLLETTSVFGSLVLVTVLGVGLFALVSALERIVVPWHEPFRRRK
jgi:ABC-type nitrate/sulfonate/bicarbonate transport system permease component